MRVAKQPEGSPVTDLQEMLPGDNPLPSGPAPGDAVLFAAVCASGSPPCFITYILAENVNDVKVLFRA